MEPLEIESIPILSKKKRRLIDEKDGSDEDPIQDSDDELIREIESLGEPINDDISFERNFKNKDSKEKKKIKNEIKQVEVAFDIQIKETELQIEDYNRRVALLRNDIFKYRRMKRNQIEMIKNKYKNENTMEDSPKDEDNDNNYFGDPRAQFKFNAKCEKVRVDKNNNTIFKIGLNQHYFGKNCCNPIAVVCACYFLSTKKSPYEFDWYSILKRGADIWTKWKRGTSDDTDFSYVSVIFSMPDFDEERKTIRIGADIGGYITENDLIDKVSFVTLEAMFNKFDDIYDHDFGIVISLNDYSYTVIYESISDKWYFYDSHTSPTEDGRCSTLIMFENKQYVYEHILKKFTNPINQIFGSPTTKQVQFSASSFIRLQDYKEEL